jgi:hypothetical protein
MEVGVRDGNPVSAVGDIEEAVQVIFAAREVTRKITVVNPDVERLVDTNGVTIVSVNLANLQVAHDNILNLTDVESNTGDG